MKNDELKFYAAQLGAKIPELDLHGLYPSDALEKLDIFIYQCVEKNTDSARVIYGGGTGKLREVVLEKLKGCKAVKNYQEEGGSVIVLF
ncbi:MAG: Smr/MutS family protein [Candidatus Magasanikbacteria bacterium]